MHAWFVDSLAVLERTRVLDWRSYAIDREEVYPKVNDRDILALE